MWSIKDASVGAFVEWRVGERSGRPKRRSERILTDKFQKIAPVGRHLGTP